MTAILPPPGWRTSRSGVLRRRLGAAELTVYRRKGRGGYLIVITLRAADPDPAMACALAEDIAGDLLALAAERRSVPKDDSRTVLQ